MHQLQKILLKRLSTKGPLRYAELTSGYDYEDNVVFHLKQLQSNSLIIKKTDQYEVTTKGVKTIAQYEPLLLVDKGVKTFFVGFLCKSPNGNFLLKTHPQAKHNFYNLPSGKPYFGEDLDESLIRLFKENTGTEPTKDAFQFTSLHMKTIKNSKNEVIFDDAFSIYSVDLTEKDIQQMKLKNELEWYSVEEIKKLEQKWPEINLCINVNEIEPYLIYTHVSDYIL